MSNPYVAVSIIINVYNGSKFLEQCIESALNQASVSTEIILVDDGSTDETPDICRRYASEFESVRAVIQQKNVGLVKARKAGLEAARGDFIAYLDGDDWIEPDFIANLWMHASRNDTDLVVGGYKEELNGVIVGEFVNVIPEGHYFERNIADQIIPRMLNTGQFSEFGIFSFLWGKLFKKKFLAPHLERVDEMIHIGEDAAALYPSILTCTGLTIISEKNYVYRQHRQSSVKSIENKRRELERLSHLAIYMNNTFRDSVHRSILVPQLESFLLSLAVIRYDIFEVDQTSGNELFPFGKIPAKSDLVICGAGTFGQHLRRRLASIATVRVVGTLDDLYQLHTEKGDIVWPLEHITTLSFDFVLIAYVNQTHIDNAVHKLKSLGAPACKIRSLRDVQSAKAPVLSQLGLCK